MTLTAVPAEGYYAGAVQVYLDEESSAINLESGDSFEMPEGSGPVLVIFRFFEISDLGRPIRIFNTSIDSQGAVTNSDSGGQGFTNVDFARPGEMVTVSGVPAEGYYLDSIFLYDEYTTGIRLQNGETFEMWEGDGPVSLLFSFYEGEPDPEEIINAITVKYGAPARPAPACADGKYPIIREGICQFRRRN